MISTVRFGICDVHRLVDFDTTFRQCSYCDLCKAWICDECKLRWDKRIEAVFKSRLERQCSKGIE